LRADRKHRAANAAELMQHVLPPRPAGILRVSRRPAGVGGRRLRPLRAGHVDHRGSGVERNSVRSADDCPVVAGPRSPFGGAGAVGVADNGMGRGRRVDRRRKERKQRRTGEDRVSSNLTVASPRRSLGHGRPTLSDTG
jgi:hypothetical protein